MIFNEVLGYTRIHAYIHTYIHIHIHIYTSCRRSHNIGYYPLFSYQRLHIIGMYSTCLNQGSHNNDPFFIILGHISQSQWLNIFTTSKSFPHSYELFILFNPNIFILEFMSQITQLKMYFFIYMPYSLTNKVILVHFPLMHTTQG